MKRKSTLNTVFIICAVLLLAAVGLAATGAFGLGRYTYEHPERYTAGEAEIPGGIRNLDLDWLSGTVTLAYHAGDTVTLRESAEREISDDLRLRWWVDGDTLRVRFAGDGFRSWSLFGRSHRKALTLTLPEGLALGDVRIHTTSGDVVVPALTAEGLTLELTSGDVRAAAGVREVRVQATSGDVALTLTGPVQTVDVDVTSGNVSVTAEEAESVRMESTSGAVGLTAERAGEVSVRTTSGGVTAALGAFRSLDAEATSGNVRLTLPEEPGFTADVHQTSGSFSSGIPLRDAEGRRVCGDGSGAVRVSVTSGDIRIDPAR